MDADAGLHPLAVEDAVHQRLLALRRDAVRPQDRQLRPARMVVLPARRDRRNRRDHDLRRQVISWSPSAGANTAGYPRCVSGWMRPRTFAAGTVCGVARDRRLRGSTITPRGDQPWRPDIDSIEEVAFAPAALDIEPIYLLAGSVELRRCVNPLPTAFSACAASSKDLISKVRRLRDVADHQTGRPDRQLRRHAQLAGAGRAHPGRPAKHGHAQDNAWAGINAVPTMIAVPMA